MVFDALLAEQAESELRLVGRSEEQPLVGEPRPERDGVVFCADRVPLQIGPHFFERGGPVGCMVAKDQVLVFKAASGACGDGGWVERAGSGACEACDLLGSRGGRFLLARSIFAGDEVGQAGNKAGDRAGHSVENRLQSILTRCRAHAHQTWDRLPQPFERQIRIKGCACRSRIGGRGFRGWGALNSQGVTEACICGHGKRERKQRYSGRLPR